ncbi:MAG: hypothetical protein K8S99_15435 [Planctomycetes bacterium]|nr:hypothetical protein [Planctomycetota bacterium]
MKNPCFQGFQSARDGLERPLKPSGKQVILRTGGAKSGALAALPMSDLAALTQAMAGLAPADRADALAMLAAWPILPPAVKAGISAMIQATKTNT